jgi:hypothetical protein
MDSHHNLETFIVAALRTLCLCLAVTLAEVVMFDSSPHHTHLPLLFTGMASDKSLKTQEIFINLIVLFTYSQQISSDVLLTEFNSALMVSIFYYF